MAKYLMISGAGEGLSTALKLRFEGHDVAVWIRDGRSKDRYDGMIKKVDRWEKFLDKDTIVLFDSRGGGKTADRLRAQGHRVIGGSTVMDQVEGDPELGREILAQAGAHPSKVVESGYFTGDRFAGSESLFSTSRDRAMPGDLGPVVGLQGQLVWAREARELPKLTEFLKQHQYEGPVAIQGDGFAPRWSAFPAAFELGAKVPFDGPLRDGFASAVRVSSPSGVEGSLLGVERSHRDRLYLQDVHLAENGDVRIGKSGSVALVSGFGETAGEAFKHSYDLAQLIQVPDKMYRNDLASLEQDWSVWINPAQEAPNERQVVSAG